MRPTENDIEHAAWQPLSHHHRWPMLRLLKGGRYGMKGVIFDFDGVLVDSFSHLAALNVHAMRAIGVPFTTVDYRRLFAGNFHKIVKELIGDQEKLGLFLAFKKKHHAEYYGNVQLFPFSKLLILTLADRFSLSIVSSTSSQHINTILNASNLTGHFAAILGSNAESKANELRHAMTAMGSTPDTTFFITDTTGDILVGKSLEIETVAITWGFHDEELLRAQQPSHLFRDPQQLLRYFCSLSDNPRRE